jgi:hypothetical protein
MRATPIAKPVETVCNLFIGTPKVCVNSRQPDISDCSLLNFASSLPFLFVVFVPATGLLAERGVAVNWLGWREKRPEVN